MHSCLPLMAVYMIPFRARVMLERCASTLSVYPACKLLPHPLLTLLFLLLRKELAYCAESAKQLGEASRPGPGHRTSSKAEWVGGFGGGDEKG